MAETKIPTNEYAVLGVGVSYTAPGEPGPVHLGLQGRVITLEQGEADRLLALGVIREATDEDRARDEAVRAVEEANRSASNPANPYGGTALVDIEEHAQQVREQAAKAK